MRIIITCLFLFLVGCSSSFKRPSTPEPALTPVPAPSKENNLSQKEKHWRAKGRLAVTQGKKGGNASFIWHQTGSRYQIKLHGPFGSGAIIITGDPQQVRAQEANGKYHYAKTPEQLMQKIVGWHVPISGLQYWIRGLPIPNVPITQQQRNAQGYLEQITQHGWIVQYNEYTFDNITLPKMIQLHNPKLKIKLIITSWS